MSDLNFCPRCGAALIWQGEEGACTNPACGRVQYRNAKPCAGVLVEQDGAVLLVRRNIAPVLGDWDIPGGYLHEWEHRAAAARREVLEETGLRVELTRLLGIFIDRYGAADAPATFNVYYRARVTGGTLAPADDASEAR